MLFFSGSAIVVFVVRIILQIPQEVCVVKGIPSLTFSLSFFSLVKHLHFFLSFSYS